MSLKPVPSNAKIPERDIGKLPVLETVHLSIEFGGLKADVYKRQRLHRAARRRRAWAGRRAPAGRRRHRA